MRQYLILSVMIWRQSKELCEYYKEVPSSAGDLIKLNNLSLKKFTFYLVFIKTPILKPVLYKTSVCDLLTVTNIYNISCYVWRMI